MIFECRQVDFGEYQDEILPLMQEMAELEVQPLDINVAAYLSAGEILKTFVWLADETVVGVALIIASASLRNRHIIDAGTDVLYIKPAYRGRGADFISAIKDKLTKQGVSYWYVSSRHIKPIGKFLERQGFCELETVYYQQL